MTECLIQPLQSGVILASRPTDDDVTADTRQRPTSRDVRLLHSVPTSAAVWLRKSARLLSGGEQEATTSRGGLADRRNTPNRGGQSKCARVPRSREAVLRAGAADVADGGRAQGDCFLRLLRAAPGGGRAGN